jgi:predicted  nucleic acid-binding Zn-ribbon protein
MADSSEGSERGEGVLTQVCVNCGKEYFYESDAPPRNQTCERCGGQVFRSFYAVTDPDDVQQDFQETTGRDTAPDDPGTDITPGDLHDLNNP